MRQILLGGLLLAVLLVGVAPAHAHTRYFTHTYDWFTATKGEKELELWWTQENGGEADGQVEFEYGVTDRYTVAPYLLLKREHGGDFSVEGWKLEQRYRLGKYARNRLLPALYLEVAKEEEGYELEGKLITSYLFGNGFVWSTNLIFAGPIHDRAKTEIGYATGISHPLTRRVQVGAEFFGNWTEEEHFFGPTIGYRLDGSSQLLLNAGFRYAGEQGGSIRLIFEKEWR